MKAKPSTRPFDAASYLTTEASIAAFVTDAMESGDPAVLQNALNIAARARGMAQIAEQSGLGRESLYKALRVDARPQFTTIVKVLGALGVQLVAKPLPRKKLQPVAAKLVRATKVSKSATPAKKDPKRAAASSRPRDRQEG